MPRPKLLSMTISAIALSLASPALAVTAEELWAEWQAQATALGQTMTAAEVVPASGSLTLRGFSSSFSDGEVSTVGRVDEIVMTENADGSVAIDMSDVYAITISFTDLPGDPPVNIGVNMIMPDLVMTARGDVGARIYDYSASRITFEEGPITGGNGIQPTIDMTIGVEDLTATYQVDGTNPENIAYTTSSEIGGIAGAIDILPPPDEEGRLKLTFALGPTSLTGSGQLGNLAELASNPEIMPTDFDLNGDITYGSASFEMTFEHPTDAFNAFASNEGGSLRTVFSESALEYRITTTGSSSYFAGGGSPVPIEYSVGSAEIALRVPLGTATDPQPVAARLAFQDVDVGDGVWAMADPAASFPRDPITVIADISGNIRVLTDLLHPDAAGAAMFGQSPAELVDMTVNELRVSVGGATLSGSGSATFAPGPVPMPVGSVDLQLSGGNALLDRLQASGLVPIEQLAMARGLLGAFARPGATPDTLESTIQFTEGGGITANGVPLQ
ncbi:uncharacterized protein DUF2125 [Roseicyclus mahoneyensis]|uniref:Uncharacterized protein DUF2125 n=2 Tax=Roseicyclus mahoneyensis TaxID=164332 RepID=A0A316GIP3_9RHOB|nr:uncharacterized protein DUF2125 [Roseicyclus mahoneyensis]